MRILLAMLLLPGIVAAQGNVEAPPPDRYGVASNLKLYPQATPKEALETATKLLEARKYDYLLAHVVDPVVVDARVTERALAIERTIFLELELVREEQKRNLDRVERLDRLPGDPQEFIVFVRAEAVKRAFKQVIKDVQETLSDYPENVKIFRRCLREGEVLDSGGTFRFSLADVPGKQVYLKRAGKRWFLEDRQLEPEKPTAPAGDK